MATVAIDGVNYNDDSLSDSAKAQVLSLQFVQAELQRLEAQIAVYKTAEAGYAKALQQELGELASDRLIRDEMTFSQSW